MQYQISEEKISGNLGIGNSIIDNKEINNSAKKFILIILS